jgi:hypothetical protein
VVYTATPVEGVGFVDSVAFAGFLLERLEHQFASEKVNGNRYFEHISERNGLLIETQRAGFPISSVPKTTDLAFQNRHALGFNG